MAVAAAAVPSLASCMALLPLLSLFTAGALNPGASLPCAATGVLAPELLLDLWVLMAVTPLVELPSGDRAPLAEVVLATFCTLLA